MQEEMSCQQLCLPLNCVLFSTMHQGLLEGVSGNIQEPSLQSSMYIFGIRCTLDRERPMDRILDRIY